MRYLACCALLLSLCCAAPAAGGTVVSAFYYPWFSTGAHDGEFTHWAQRGHIPPDDIASNFYPAFGAYSSSSASVVELQLQDVVRAGIDELVVSWWGRGSAEDRRLPTIIGAATARGIAIAAHLEPYTGRTVASTSDDVAYLRTLGVDTFYLYRPFDLPAAYWAEANDKWRSEGLTVFAQTALVGAAVKGHFGGVYTYDILVYGGGLFSRLCRQARAKGLLCAPSVGPGYEADRATGDARMKPRRNGRTYDSMWTAA